MLQGIEALSETPLPFGVRRLSGAEHLYRIRVGDYRIIYAMHHAEQEVIVLYIRHRRSAYRGL
ncbi:type II toxin-antitoxin system RelE/ParE family toxin [Methanoculleus sp.]|uniref:type II toxin-antitoxin system RelE family toxin n=1 Tax=Methanoculleus sp. TaxID=90427 RepID=UPI001BD2A99D